MSDLQVKLDRGAWSVPEGWTAERLAQCGRCYDQVLWCLTGKATRLKFNRDGSDHGFTCPGVMRRGVNRSYKGQHDGKPKWETKC